MEIISVVTTYLLDFFQTGGPAPSTCHLYGINIINVHAKM